MLTCNIGSKESCVCHTIVGHLNDLIRGTKYNSVDVELAPPLSIVRLLTMDDNRVRRIGKLLSDSTCNPNRTNPIFVNVDVISLKSICTNVLTLSTDMSKI
jgi:hypothetical protein